MTASFFTDKSTPPDAAALAEALGSSMKLWQDLRAQLEGRFGPLIEEWKFYSGKSGWIMKLLCGKRNLFFSLPLEGCFRVTFVFGNKAVVRVQKSGLPEGIVSDLVNARKYAEGRGVQIEVRSAKDVGYVVRLAGIKLQ